MANALGGMVAQITILTQVMRLWDNPISFYYEPERDASTISDPDAKLVRLLYHMTETKDDRGNISKEGKHFDLLQCQDWKGMPCHFSISTSFYT